MKKISQILTTLFMAMLIATLGLNGHVQAQASHTQPNIMGITMPVSQVIVYEEQSVPYEHFSAAIFAQGQITSLASELPSDSQIAFYVDANKVNGATGLQNGTRCTSTQANASYYKNTITMDKRFCQDFNDAILDGRSVYGMVPNESIFIHKANGERCYANGNGGAYYMINPASPFIRNYLVHRGAEKMAELGVNTFFLDNLQPGLSGITQRCGGNPKEYPNLNDYINQIAEMAKHVNTNLPNYRVQGNLSNAVSSEWNKLSFLNGAMCESCFSDWGNNWPSAAEMLSDLAVLDTWVNQNGRDVYIVIQPPDTTEASNRFTFAASLLVARNNGKGVYFHFGEDYSQTHLIPEYQYDLGLPTAARTCNGNICMRTFERGIVRVDFAARQGLIMLGAVPTMQATSTTIPPTTTSTASPIASATFTAIPTLASPTTTLTQIIPNATQTATSTLSSPTATYTASPAPTIASTQTTSPTRTATAPIPPTQLPTGQNSVDIKVSNGKNDAEENAQGQMYLNSSDLELVYDSSSQVIGIRFVNVKIPKGATIASAYIQFKVDNATSQAVTVNIAGEASANAAVFNTTARNISSRSRTINSVVWSPAAWTKAGARGAEQRTPNLAPVIQEIINQTGWVSGNSLAIIITGDSGKRVAKSYEGDSAGAPLLHIEYNIPASSAVINAATPTATWTATTMPSITPTETTIVLPTETPSPTAIIPPTETETPIEIPTETPQPTPTP